MAENEITAAVREAARQRAAARPAKIAKTTRKHWPLAAIGLGIGSAAVVAALLYASGKKED